MSWITYFFARRTAVYVNGTFEENKDFLLQLKDDLWSRYDAVATIISINVDDDEGKLFRTFAGMCQQLFGCKRTLAFELDTPSAKAGYSQEALDRAEEKHVRLLSIVLKCLKSVEPRDAATLTRISFLETIISGEYSYAEYFAYKYVPLISEILSFSDLPSYPEAVDAQIDYSSDYSSEELPLE